MSETAGRVAKLDDTESSIAAVDAQNRDALEAQFRVDAPSQCVALHAIVLKIGKVPRNISLGDGGIGGGGIDDGDFRAQGNAGAMCVWTLN